MSDDESVWWKTAGAGLFMIGITFFLYYYLTHLEESGGRGRINWIIALTYNIGGKWLSCSVTGLFGCLLVWIGYKQWQES